jgi:hypothetical protein
VIGRHAPEVLDVTSGVDLFAAGHVGGVGAFPTWGHTAITTVERHASFAVAQAFAGHSASSVTGTYTQARISEVAQAVSVLTGEAHPLASI